jgi:hypothetical protein
MDLSGDGLSLVASCPGGSNGEVALTGLVKVLPSQVEYGRKLVMLSLVWMPMIDSVAQSLSRTMARGLLLLRTSTMDLEDIFACSISQVSWVQFGSDIDGENSADRFGNGIFSVTLTGDGSRVVDQRFTETQGASVS